MQRKLKVNNLNDLIGIDLSILDDDSLEESDSSQNVDIKNVFDINHLKQNINNCSTKTICNMIVANRYLGFNKEFNINCMTELSNRRKNGDDFLFEDYIEEKLKKMPKINFDTKNIMNIIASASKMK